MAVYPSVSLGHLPFDHKDVKYYREQGLETSEESTRSCGYSDSSDDDNSINPQRNYMDINLPIAKLRQELSVKEAEIDEIEPTYSNYSSFKNHQRVESQKRTILLEPPWTSLAAFDETMVNKSNRSKTFTNLVDPNQTTGNKAVLSPHFGNNSHGTSSDSASTITSTPRMNVLNKPRISLARSLQEIVSDNLKVNPDTNPTYENDFSEHFSTSILKNEIREIQSSSEEDSAFSRSHSYDLNNQGSNQTEEIDSDIDDTLTENETPKSDSTDQLEMHHQPQVSVDVERDLSSHENNSKIKDDQPSISNYNDLQWWEGQSESNESLALSGISLVKHHEKVIPSISNKKEKSTNTPKEKNSKKVKANKQKHEVDQEVSLEVTTQFSPNKEIATQTDEPNFMDKIFSNESKKESDHEIQNFIEQLKHTLSQYKSLSLATDHHIESLHQEMESLIHENMSLHDISNQQNLVLLSLEAQLNNEPSLDHVLLQNNQLSKIQEDFDKLKLKYGDFKTVSIKLNKLDEIVKKLSNKMLERKSNSSLEASTQTVLGENNNNEDILENKSQILYDEIGRDSGRMLKINCNLIDKMPMEKDMIIKETKGIQAGPPLLLERLSYEKKDQIKLNNDRKQEESINQLKKKLSVAEAEKRKLYNTIHQLQHSESSKIDSCQPIKLNNNNTLEAKYSEIGKLIESGENLGFDKNISKTCVLKKNVCTENTREMESNLFMDQMKQLVEKCEILKSQSDNADDLMKESLKAFYSNDQPNVSSEKIKNQSMLFGPSHDEDNSKNALKQNATLETSIKNINLDENKISQEDLFSTSKIIRVSEQQRYIDSTKGVSQECYSSVERNRRPEVPNKSAMELSKTRSINNPLDLPSEKVLRINNNRSSNLGVYKKCDPSEKHMRLQNKSNAFFSAGISVRNSQTEYSRSVNSNKNIGNIENSILKVDLTNIHKNTSTLESINPIHTSKARISEYRAILKQKGLLTN